MLRGSISLKFLGRMQRLVHFSLCGNGMKDSNSEDYFRKRLRGEGDLFVNSEIARFKKRLEEFGEIYYRELERVKPYLDQEGEMLGFEQKLWESIVAGNVGFVRGSFMEYASPYLKIIDEAIASTEQKITALRALKGDDSPELMDAINFFNKIKARIEEFQETPLHKLREDNGEHGKQILSEISADINHLYQYLVEILQS
jgi:hypothetical protein